MADLIRETISLAPRIVFDRAKKLKNLGLYKQALDILIENSVSVDIYEERIEMKLPAIRKKRNYHFSKQAG